LREKTTGPAKDMLLSRDITPPFFAQVWTDAPTVWTLHEKAPPATSAHLCRVWSVTQFFSRNIPGQQDKGIVCFTRRFPAV
jgi:hypothetical protein